MLTQNVLGLLLLWATQISSRVWHNREGGPIQEDPLERLLQRPLKIGIEQTAAKHNARVADTFDYSAGSIAPGGELGMVVVDSTEEAQAACSALVECRGFTFTNSTAP